MRLCVLSCVDGYVYAWLRAWMAACIVVCMDGCMYGSLCVKKYVGSTYIKKIKNPLKGIIWSKICQNIKNAVKLNINFDFNTYF